jgi:hypothetical protein
LHSEFSRRRASVTGLSDADEERHDVRVGEPCGEADLLAEALAAHRMGQLGGRILMTTRRQSAVFPAR